MWLVWRFCRLVGVISSNTAVLLFWFQGPKLWKGNYPHIHLDNYSSLITCFTLLRNNIISWSSLTPNAFNAASGYILHLNEVSSSHLISSSASPPVSLIQHHHLPVCLSPSVCPSAHSLSPVSSHSSSVFLPVSAKHFSLQGFFLSQPTLVSPPTISCWRQRCCSEQTISPPW